VRGYFGIGVERISKPMNAGNLFRSAHAFGASFVFTIAAHYSVREGRSDTSESPEQLPWYAYDDVADFDLPQGCRLVGIELMDEAVELPVFRHPPQAAYVLGPEMGSLSPELVARCDHIIRIPTKFCINVAMAGAIVMYDRLITIGKFGQRPVSIRGKSAPPAAHKEGSRR
jgi:tRNA G18 (ribose-2'-O)-methylase SpoU